MQRCWEEPYHILDIDARARHALASGYGISEDATWYACPLVLRCSVELTRSFLQLEDTATADIWDSRRISISNNVW